MIDTIITRMRRRIDVIRLDAKARQDVLYHDMNELLSLLDMLERELDAELAKVESGRRGPMTKIYMRGRAHYGTAAEMMDRIDELETKLKESEARSEVLETLVMDVAADLYDGVAAHKIDQRIMDAIRQLDEEGEDQ
jgi:seryl-tRNA synthetase